MHNFRLGGLGEVANMGGKNLKVNLIITRESPKKHPIFRNFDDAPPGSFYSTHTLTQPPPTTICQGFESSISIQLMPSDCFLHQVIQS